MNCALHFLSLSKYRADTHVLPNTHDYYEIVYYLHGTGIAQIGDKPYSYRPNTYTVISPGTLHTDYHAEASEVLFITFQYQDSPILKSGFFSDTEANLRLLSVLRQMKYEIAQQGEHYREILRHLLCQAILLASREVTPSTSRNKDFTYIINYIDAYYAQQISVESLARLCNYSYDYFRHLFKLKMGRSPRQYIMQKRLEQTRNLLANTGLSLLEVALESGFSTASQFSLIFRNSCGVSPGAYRRQNKK